MTVFYVGIGVASRPYRKDGRNALWKRIVNKNNDEFIVTLIGEDLLWEFCCEVEKGLIKTYGRLNNKTGILCNMTDGGEGGYGIVITEEARIKRRYAASNRSPEYREKQRIAHTGHHRNKGIIRTPEYCIKMSLAKKGKKQSDAHRLKNITERIKHNGYLIEQVCLKTGVVIKVFTGIRGAGRYVGVGTSGIMLVIKGKHKQAGGFFWRKLYDLSSLDKLIAVAHAA